MTNPLTPDLERLNELYEKATPGEWSCHAPGCCGWIDYDDGVICDVKNNTDDLQDATGYAPTREQARANQEWIAAAHNAWPALYAQLRAAAPNRPIAQEAQQGPYHPSIAEQEVLRRALLASVKVIHPGVIAAEPPHAQAATAVSGDAAAHANHKPDCVIHRGGCCTCGAPMTVEEKERSNTWDHLSDFVEVWKAHAAGKWEWYANSKCKYVELRIDMRTGHCIIRNRDGKRISPNDLAYQYRLPTKDTPASEEGNG